MTGETANRATVVRIGVYTVVSAVFTWGVLVYAGRELGPAGYARFMVVWGTFFIISGLWQGLHQEVARSLSAARSADRGERRLVAATIGIGAVAAVLFLALGLALGQRLLGIEPAETWILAAGVFTFALVNGYSGSLIAGDEWGHYARGVLVEACLRSALLVGVIAFAGGAAAQAAALVGGALAWIAVSASTSARRAARALGDTGSREFVSRVGQAMLATGCSVLVVAGFPVLLDLTTSGSLGLDAGVLLTVVIVTRAPYLVVVNALQGIMITRLVAAGPESVHTLRTWLSRVGMALVPLALGGYLVGPQILRWIFGDAFDATGSLFVGLVVAAAAVTVVTLTGWAVLAEQRHTIYLWGWLAALVVTVLTLLLPLGLEMRSVAALALGPLVGAGVHLGAQRRSRRLVKAE